MSSASSHSAPSASSLQLSAFSGGGRWMVGGGAVGLLFLIVSLAGLALSPREAAYSYLVAFAYWCGISMASVILLMIFHTTRAKWMTVLRRPVEAMAATVPIFILLFIPVALSLKQIYVWVDPPADLPKETLHLIAHKRPYLNTSFFLVRSVIYLVFAALLGQLLFGWSTRQDSSGAVGLTQKQRNLGAGGLPFIALTFTFAAFDWLMSLKPEWFSTIFGVYYFAGSFVSALSLLAVICDLARGDKNLFGDYVSPDHTHNVGKLMLAFTCFWTYIAFSQLLLIWIAGLPEEIPFYITRFKRGWAGIGVFMIFGHFFLPFGALLSRSLKRNPRRLALVGIWILLVHYIDIYWLVMPNLYPEGFQFHWTSVTAFLGIGLLAIAFGVFRLRGKLAVPLKDPYLGDSLRYRQP